MGGSNEDTLLVARCRLEQQQTAQVYLLKCTCVVWTDDTRGIAHEPPPRLSFDQPKRRFPLKKSVVAATALGLVVLVVLGAWWLLAQRPRSSGPSMETGPAAAPAPSAPMPMAQTASGPDVRHPLELAGPPASTSQPATAIDVESVLTDLFGRKAALGMFQLDDFARRVAATVDNLGRSHAPSRLWPVNPAEGRFLALKQGDSEVISADNGLRYTPYVLLIETVDLRQVVTAYRKLYPQLQTAYEELGYPRRYFNDRVVEVLDQLLATPDIDAAPKVRLPAINGPMQPQRPWVLYEYEDPTLQSLSAGQRMLLRTGPVNERRLKAKLAELRRLLATGATRQ